MKKKNIIRYVLTIGIVLITLVLAVVSAPVIAESTNILPVEIYRDGPGCLGYFQIYCNVDSATVTFNTKDNSVTRYVNNGGVEFSTIVAIPITSITVTADGYQPQTITNVTMPREQETVFYNITLVPKSTIGGGMYTDENDLANSIPTINPALLPQEYPRNTSGEIDWENVSAPGTIKRGFAQIFCNVDDATVETVVEQDGQAPSICEYNMTDGSITIEVFAGGSIPYRHVTSIEISAKGYSSYNITNVTLPKSSESIVYEVLLKPISAQSETEHPLFLIGLLSGGVGSLCAGLILLCGGIGLICAGVILLRRRK